MFSKLLSPFGYLTKTHTSLMFLRRITAARDAVMNVFVNIYTFQFTQDISLLLLGNIIYFTSSIITYFFISVLYSKRSLNLKIVFYVSYVLFIVGGIFLYVFHGLSWGVMVFYMIMGCGNAFFYFSTVSYESSHIKKKSLDLFGSVVKSGRNMLKVLVPLAVSGVFLATSYTSISGYVVLFGLLPFLFLVGFFVVGGLPDARLSSMPLHQLRQKFSRKNIRVMSFYFFYGIDYCLPILLSMIVLILLQSEVHIGVYEAGLGLISSLSVFYMSTYITMSNRKRLFMICSVVFLCAVGALGAYVSWTTFIIMSLVTVTLQPLIDATKFAYFYDVMHTIRTGNTDLYAITFTSFFINISRVLLLGVLYMIHMGGIREWTFVIQLGLILLSCTYVILYSILHRYFTL